MDRRAHTDTGTEVDSSYARALEFIGEVRGGIAYERLCFYARQNSKEMIDMIQGTEDTLKFLHERNIDRSYVVERVKEIFYQLHFNRLNDYYVTLLLPQSASDQEIHKRWKDLMLIYHPDRKAFPVEYATACAVRLNEAYATLKDPLRRSAYDRDLIKRMKRPAIRATAKPIGTLANDSCRFFSSIRVKASKVIIPATIVAAAIILCLLYSENKGENPTLYEWKGVFPETARNADVVNTQSVDANAKNHTAVIRAGQTTFQAGITADPDWIRMARADDDLMVEVHSFLHLLAIAYDEGNLNGYLSLYSTSAVENNGLGYNQIREAYRKQFAKSRFVYNINNPEIRTEGKTVMVGANYSIKSLSGPEAGKVWGGNIRLLLVRENGELKILRNNYDYR